MKEKVTIITGEVPYFNYVRTLKIAYKKLLQKYRNYKPRPFELLMYGGHYGVTRSMIEGLQKNNEIDVNYNPRKKSDIANLNCRL